MSHNARSNKYFYLPCSNIHCFYSTRVNEGDKQEVKKFLLYVAAFIVFITLAICTAGYIKFNVFGDL